MTSIVVKPKEKEKRSRRTNFLVTPSLYKQAEKKCKKMGISLNECINQLLESWVNEDEKVLTVSKKKSSQ